jgi:transcriptional regulator with XRE-family HTH domain
MRNSKAMGARVEKMRLKRHWELQDLVRATGISYQSLWRIERGLHKDPGVFTAAKIAKALGCSVDYLAGLYEDDDSELLPTLPGLAVETV